MRSNNIGTATVGIAAWLAGTADAFWRMPCSGRLLLERADPIVNAGKVSGHVHTISGGNGFGFTTSYDQMRASTCSSCPIKEDLSVYWTPSSTTRLRMAPLRTSLRPVKAVEGLVV